MSKARVHSNHFVTVAAFSLLSLVLIWVLLGPGSATAQSNSAPGSEQSGSQPTPSTNASFSVDYTGALYGYYRIEPDDPQSEKLNPPKAFLEHKPDHLLLGMGDNFAPEFGASVQREFVYGHPCFLRLSRPLPGHKNLAPEVLYKDEHRLPPMAECDNVGRFLMKAGYSAIVPGKEDFLYSARWLRTMALLFREARATNEVGVANTDHKPLMLAANLRVNLKAEGLDLGHRLGIEKQELAKQVKETCPLLFTWDDPLASTPKSCVLGGDNGNTVTKDMDWVRRLDLIVDQEPNCIPKPEKNDDCLPVARSMNLQARQNTTFRKQLLENEVRIALAALSQDIDHDNCSQAKLKELFEGLGVLGGVSGDDKAVKAFRKIESDSTPLYLSSEGQTRLTGLPVELQCSGPGDADVNPILHELHDRFTQLLSDLDQSNMDFLFSLTARKAAIRLLLRKIAAEQKDVGYTIAAPSSAPRTLVIGVIGQKTMKAVSPVNLQLCTLGIPLNHRATAENFGPCIPPEDRRVYEDAQGKHFADKGNDAIPEAYGKLVGTIKVGDPVLAVTTLVRAAWEVKDDSLSTTFDRVVVMAQMPLTEAEELGARVLGSLKKTGNCAELPTATLPNANISCADSKDSANLPHVDLIISEAQPGHTTHNVTLKYSLESAIPVVSPRPAWYIRKDERGLVWPVSTVAIETLASGNKRILTNELERDDSDPRAECQEKPQHSCLETMSQLLYKELSPGHSRDLINLRDSWEGCHEIKACQNSAMRQFLLTQIQRDSHADAVLVEYRDFYFGSMLDERDDKGNFQGYGSYQICDTWIDDQKKWLQDQLTKPDVQIRAAKDDQRESLEDRKKKLLDDQMRLTNNGVHLIASCQLRVALDRILWKGDYSERVTVDGKTLKNLLTMAQQETDDEQTLAARDTTGEFLLTFGIVTKPPENLSAASMGPETFSIPGIGFCKPGADAQGPEYCVNGQKISDDGAYGIATTDHLAKDTEVYKLLSAQDSRYHWRKPVEFLTAEIADEIDRGRSGSAPDTPNTMSKVEEYQQARPILQLDYAKAVAGFMIRRPNTSNVQLGSNFSGVADSRATTPSAQELDFEAVTRMTMGLGAGEIARRAKLGVQSDLEYDRAVTGSLTGSETVTYALNSFTTGGFFQYRLSGDPTLPRWLLVVAPYQYQQQITGNYLNFKVTEGKQQITVPTVPTKQWEGFTQRLGLRYEIGGPKWRMFDSGSYAESGPEYSGINHILSGLKLPNGMVCSATETSFTQCLGNMAVTSSTVLTPEYLTLHTWGAYWDVHLQKALDKNKRSSITIETKGDHFGPAGTTLPTQSRYAFTTTGALNFAVVGNLALSPTYMTFFYRNQGDSQESHFLITNTFSITMKWYFARDAAIRPFWRQLWFRGPASSDQTKSAKMK
jgi:hypothetical protein